MTLYSYVIARDFAFAPNPFYGVCTLATCKPKIRAAAVIGDWILATGSKAKRRDGYLVYAMNVDEILTFDEYWKDPRFRQKRPLLNGSLKQRYGDNIYHRDKSGRWIQENSHHSFPDGTPNPRNIKRDTSTTTRVLLGRKFGYWGRIGPKVPARLRQEGTDICSKTQGHKSRFDDRLVQGFLAWMNSLELDGFMGTPTEFP
jgi:hypothetical protein